MLMLVSGTKYMSSPCTSACGQGNGVVASGKGVKRSSHFGVDGDSTERLSSHASSGGENMGRGLHPALAQVVIIIT
jgi:hypothetical protein